MSFSWYCEDFNGNDLFDEFHINGQALGLGGSSVTYSVSDIRQHWAANSKYANKLKEAAQDIMREAQAKVQCNLNQFNAPPHQCPMCRCKAEHPKEFLGFDADQAKRFVSIPLDRVKRAGGGW